MHLPILNISIPPLVFALILIGVAQFVRGLYRKRQFNLWASSKGAEKPVRVKFYLPWALDGLFRTLYAARTGKEDYLHDIFLARQRYLNRGSWYVKGFLNKEVISTCDPRNIQAIFSTQFDDFEQGELREAQMKVVLGKSIFNTDGEAWAGARSMFRPLFSRSNINNLEETEQAIQLLLTLLPEENNGWTGTIDVQPMFYRFTMDTATAFIFGKSVESQKRAIEGEEDVFAEAFNLSNEWITTRIILQSLYFLSDGKKYRNAAQEVRKIADQVIQLSLNQKRSTDEKGEKYSVVQELANNVQDPIQIRDQVIALLAAGRDTTAALLSWALYLLATDTRVFNKLRKTIIQEFGTTVEPTKPLDFAALKSCRYLQWVISETLRVYPVVPLNVRRAVRDTTLPVGGGLDGTKPMPVQKGQSIGTIIYCLHRRKDLWGEDADDFIPERWENKRPDWSYVPFSGGPRICLGQQYAIVEASYLIVRFLQTFDAITWEGEEGSPIKQMGITTTPRNGVPLKLRYARS